MGHLDEGLEKDEKNLKWNVDYTESLRGQFKKTK